MTVTLHVWRIPPRRLPRMLWRVARDGARLRQWSQAGGPTEVRFARLLGTGAGDRLGPGSADLTRWAALVDGTIDYRNELATATCQVVCEPLAARGSWAGWRPKPSQPAGNGMVLALTHARLNPRKALRFWRAIDEPARATQAAPGLVATFGIGEAPIGYQGTVSLWRSAADLVEFAYHHPAHRRAIDRTGTEGWYAQALFARFAVGQITGDRDLLGLRGAA